MRPDFETNFVSLRPSPSAPVFEPARVLRQLPLFTRGPAGEVTAQDGQLAGWRVKAQLQVAPFGIELRRTKTHHDVAGLPARVHPHARVTFFLRKMEMAGQSGKRLELARDVRRLGLDLLYANTIGPCLRKPGFEPFAGGGSDAV